MSSLPQVMQPLVPLVEVQRVFCLMKMAGQLLVVERQQVTDVLSGVWRGEVDFYRAADATKLIRRFLEQLPVSSDSRQVISSFWIDSATHVYDAIAFSPLPTPLTTLNYWVPSPVVPQSGDWSVIGEFLRDVICDGDGVLYEYLIGYLAHMLQKPEEKPGVMLVLLGGQGTGKGTFFVLVRRVWPRTTLQVSDVDEVTGKFNAALERNYVICMDEALFSGDRKALDRLKSLVTERHVTVEQKHQPRREIESFHRFFAASNHDHFAKVAPDDRRFVFLRVSDAHKEDHGYFKTVHTALLDDAAISAMVYDLLALDLSGFNVRDRPKTQEHTEQKLKSLEGFDRYWFEVLQTGDLSGGGAGAISKPWDKNPFVGTAALRQNCERFHSAVRQFHTLQAQYISAGLKKWCPQAVSTRKVEHGNQVRGYNLPSLTVARQAFESGIGGQVDWQ